METENSRNHPNHSADHAWAPDMPPGELPIPDGRAGASPEDALPMVVWLRGDEEYCGEFSLEAQDVMNRLGIRRSRLTQISGRELRVGRIRRGRYISPVYRPEDVETYAAWTRPTASHVRSSKVLSEAADRLAEESRFFGVQVQAVADSAADAVAGTVQESLRPLVSMLQELLSLQSRYASVAERHADARHGETAAGVEQLVRTGRQSGQHLSEIVRSVATHEIALKTLLQDNTALLAQVRQLQEQLSALSATHLHAFAGISSQLEVLASHQSRYARRRRHNRNGVPRAHLRRKMAAESAGPMGAIPQDAIKLEKFAAAAPAKIKRKLRVRR